MEQDEAITTKKSFWFYIVVAFIFLQYWTMFDKALNGVKIGTATDLPGGILMSGICWWYVWKQLNRKPLLGAAIGVVAFLFVLFVAMALAPKQV